MIIKGIHTGISLILLFGLSFHFGRLFEIFAWNNNIVRVESISQKVLSDQSNSCQYSELNDRYWGEKVLEDAKIRIDFSDRYVYLNEEADACIEKHQHKFLSFRFELVRRLIYRYLDFESDVIC